MAGYVNMLMRSGAPAYSSDQLGAHLRRLAQLRGAEPWMQRFTSYSVRGKAGQLHLDVIVCDASAPTVVFVPGTNAYALLYGEFLTALADHGFNVVGLDPRGHGRSDGLRGSYVLEELMDDLDTAVQWSKTRFEGPVMVAGSSQGGITAFYYAATGADIAGIVCHNIADLSDAESARLMRYPVLGRWLRPYIDAFAKRAPELPVPMRAYLDLGAEPVRGAGTALDVLMHDPLTVPFVRLRALASLASGPFPNPAASIKCPVMVLHAGADAIFPADYVHSVFERLECPKEFKLYPGLPHYMVVDHVSAFMDDVVVWIRAHGGCS